MFHFVECNLVNLFYYVKSLKYILLIPKLYFVGLIRSPSPQRSSLPARAPQRAPAPAPPPPAAPMAQPQQPSMFQQMAATAGGVAVGSAVVSIFNKMDQ